jgi:hypothetical protein
LLIVWVCSLSLFVSAKAVSKHARPSPSYSFADIEYLVLIVLDGTRRIPLARIMLQTIIDVSKHKPSVYFVVLLSLVIQTAVSIFYSFAAIAVYVTWTPGNPCEWHQRGRIGAIWVAVVD